MAARKKAAKAAAVETVKNGVESGEEPKGFLTVEAFAEWTKPRDEFGTLWTWFVRGRELRRIANRLAGGPGGLMEMSHWLFRSIVMEGKSPQEVLGNAEKEVRRQASFIGELEQLYLRCVVWGEDFRGVYGYLLEAAQKRSEKKEELRPREKAAVEILQNGREAKAVLGEMGVKPSVVAQRAKTREVELPEALDEKALLTYRLLVKKEDPLAVFGDLGVDEEKVRKLSLCRPLTLDELETVVGNDGEELVECAACGRKFQPVAAKVVKQDLSDATVGKLDASYFAGNDYGLFTRGAWLVVWREESDSFQPLPFHGPHHKVGPRHFKGDNHLFLMRKEIGRDRLALSFSEGQARRLSEEKNSRLAEQQAARERISALARSRQRPLLGGLEPRDQRRRNRRR